MVKNRVPKATHVGLDVLCVGVYEAIVHIYTGEKAVLDIMELLKIYPGYYMTKSCRSDNIRHKRSSIYRMLELQKKKKTSEGAVPFQKKQQDKNIETEGTTYEKGSFYNPVLADWFHYLLFYKLKIFYVSIMKQFFLCLAIDYVGRAVILQRLIGLQ